MKRGYKYRIYPNEEQKKYIDLCINADRMFWNYLLGEIDSYYKENKKHIRAIDVEKNLKSLKEEYTWLKNADSSLFHYVSVNLDDSFTRFFKEISNKPTYKKKTYYGSYTSHVFTTDLYKNDGCTLKCVNFKKGYIALRKAGKVKTIFHRKFKGVPKRFTISKKSFDFYEVSILVDDIEKEKQKQTPTIDGTVGIDLGVKYDSNAILDDGTKFETYDCRKDERRLKILQKKQKRCVWHKTGRKVFSKRYNAEIDETKPSKNYIKIKNKVAKQYAKIARKRSYNSHLLTSCIVKNDNINTICMEDLDVAGMLKRKKQKNIENKEQVQNTEGSEKKKITRKQERNIKHATANANLGTILRQFEYKSKWNGKNFIRVDRYYASSQTCHVCGYKNPIVKDLNIREWVCPICGTLHDRDINAAINLKKEGFRITEGKL